MRRATAGALIALACTAGVAQARPATTTVQTIVDRDGDNRLDTGPGEAHLLRDDLGVKAPLVKDGAQMVFFAQLTDTHVVDEESPLRVEFTDKYGSIFTSAYRPHEGLSPQVMDEMVEQVRNTTSPVNGRPLDLVMTTGDNTDNSQCNETRWMVDLMDGDTTVDPDSGLDAPRTFTDSELCLQPDGAPATIAPACDVPPNGKLYDGVRGGGEYYEPDSSAPGEDGPGYQPEQGARDVRDYPGLFERMNEPFLATGFDDLPWYGIFGNHDGLIQGNQPRNPAFEAYATGCLKARSVQDEPDSFPDVTGEILGGTPATMAVPPDPRRRPLRKQEYIAEHFKTTGTPVGHGFTADNLATGEGNYAITPKPGLRFIVLDSIAEGGLEQGNIDDPQFRWLHAELSAADAAKELAVIFAHHSIRTMGQPPVSPFPYGDTGGNLTPLVHYGDGPRETGISQPCLTTDAAAPTYPTETLRCLLLRHRSVIAFVNGHEHANRVTPFERSPGTGRAQGGFWEINTASHIDWPQQSRVIDIVDNPDQTISIFATIVDHGAPLRPGEGPATDAVDRLASISRELSFNDPHAANGEDGTSDARGTRKDRNVELVVRDPR